MFPGGLHIQASDTSALRRVGAHLKPLVTKREITVVAAVYEHLPPSSHSDRGHMFPGNPANITQLV